MEVFNSTFVADSVLESFQLVAEASDYEDKNEVLSMFGKVTFSTFIGAAGVILNILRLALPGLGILPDRKHDQIMAEFDNIRRGFALVNGEIDRLSQELKWEATKLQYKDDINLLELASGYAVRIGESWKDNATKMSYMNMLADTCSQQRCRLAINSIMKGVSGNDVFFNDILGAVYETSGGNRKQVVQMSARLFMLLTGGLTTLLTYDTMQYGISGANLTRNDLEPQFKSLQGFMTAQIQRCEDEYQINARNDIETIILQLGSGAANADIAKDTAAKLAPKFDWLDFNCVVYDSTSGYDNHFLSGEQVFYRDDQKCVVCFANEKDSLQPFSVADGQAAMTWLNEPGEFSLLSQINEISLAYFDKLMTDIPPFFCRCDLEANKKYFVPNATDFWGIKDASCMCELFQEAWKSTGGKYFALGCWKTRWRDLRFSWTNDQDASRKFCKTGKSTLLKSSIELCVYIDYFHPYTSRQQSKRPILSSGSFEEAFEHERSLLENHHSKMELQHEKPQPQSFSFNEVAAMIDESKLVKIDGRPVTTIKAQKDTKSSMRSSLAVASGLFIMVVIVVYFVYRRNLKKRHYEVL